MLERLVVGTFIAAFFAALPFWFLTTQEGKLHFKGSGNPWRCTVEREWLWKSRTDAYTPSLIYSSETQLKGKGRLTRAWQLVFKQNEERHEVLASVSTDERVVELAAKLDKARADGQEIDVELPAEFTYYLALVLVFVFAACGYLIAFAGRTKS